MFDIVSAEAFPQKIVWEWAGAEISCLQGCLCMGLTEVELGSINSLVFSSTCDYFLPLFLQLVTGDATITSVIPSNGF